MLHALALIAEVFAAGADEVRIMEEWTDGIVRGGIPFVLTGADVDDGQLNNFPL